MPSEATAKTDFKPESNCIDFRSVKIQMLFGSILILAVCLSCYWCTFKIGFLLDDVLHIDYCAKALSGHPAAFLNNFTGNWAGSDLMKSYRPLSSLSIFLDYLAWGSKPFGFHLTNLLIFSACCLLVSLIVLELTGLYGNRLKAAPAIWSGLLFAVYPLHAESVAWMIGRVDLLSTFFYLSAVYAYMRFRLLRERNYFRGSLLCFLAALAGKEMAVTLPVVIALAELTLYSGAGRGVNSGVKALSRVKWVSCFWALLAAYAICRGLLLGTVVGGYGDAGGMQALRACKNFLDRPTLWKLVFPSNEEVRTHIWLKTLLSGCFLSSFLLAAWRLVRRQAKPGPFLFLSAWAAIGVLPTFQIWHIYPNLVGSRLFFLSSAPLCMLITLALLPGLDWLPKRLLKISSVAGVAILAAILLSWTSLLEADLQPWLAASKLMDRLRKQVIDLASSTRPGQHVLLLNLPSDFSGAGMLTRPQYLSIIASPPFAPRDLSDRFLTVETSSPGSQDLMQLECFNSALASTRTISILKWDMGQGRFKIWKLPGGERACSFKPAQNLELSLEPAGTIIASDSQWSIVSDKTPLIERHPDFLRIFPGAAGVTLWMPPVRLNPIAASTAGAEMVIHEQAGAWRQSSGKIKFVWRSSESVTSGQALSNQVPFNQAPGQSKFPGSRRPGYVVPLAQYRKWSLDGEITRIGLKAEPGNYCLDLYGLSVD